MKKLLLIVVLFPLTVAAGPVVKTWLGFASTDWFEPGNWSPVGVPDGDDYIVFTNGNTMTMSGPVFNNNYFLWSSGTMEADLHLGADALMELLPGGSKVLQGVLTNDGTLRLPANTTFYLDNTGGNTRLVNVGDLNSEGNDTFTDSGVTGAVIENRGRFHKVGGTGTTLVDSTILFISTNLVEAQTGTIQLENSMLAGVLAGPGTNLLTGPGSHTLTGTLQASNVVVNLGNDAVRGTNATLSGDWTWQTGYLGRSAGDSFTLATNSVLKASTDWIALHGMATNLGTIQLTGNAIFYLDHTGGGTRLVNVGLLDSLGDDSFQYSAITGGVIENQGTFRKSGGTGTTTLDSTVRFTSSNTVEAQIGKISHENSVLSGNVIGTGTGSNVLAGVGHVLIGTVYASNILVSLVNQELRGTNVTLTGDWTWQTGYLGRSAGDSFTLATNSVLKVSTDWIALHGMATNLGTIQLMGNAIFYLDHTGGGTRLVNVGLLDSLGDDSFQYSAITGGVIENQGTFRKSGGTGTTTLDSTVRFVSSNTVEAQIGKISHENSVLSGNVIGTGTGSNVLAGVGHVLIGTVYASNILVSLVNQELRGTNVTLTGDWTWQTGYLGRSAADSFTLAAGSRLEVYSSGLKLQGVCTNLGTIQLTGDTTFYLDQTGGGTRLVNVGLLDSQGNGAFQSTVVTGGVIENQGTFRKSGGTGTTTLDSTVRFVSMNTVEAQIGKISHENSVLSGNVIGTGTGSNVLAGTGHVLLGTVNASNVHVNLVNQELRGTNVTLTGEWTWQMGYLGRGASDRFTLGADSVLNVVTDWIGLQGMWTNLGTIRLTGNSIFYLDDTGGSTRFVNFGLIDSQGTDLFDYTVNVGGVLDNRGIWRKSGGTTTTMDSNVTFTNSGTLDALAGTMAFSGPAYKASGGRMNFRLNSLGTFGRISFTGAATLTGTVAAERASGFFPPAGSAFNVITYTSYTGGFTNSDLPPGYNWSQVYSNTFFRLSITAVTNIGAPAELQGITAPDATTREIALLLEPDRFYHMEMSTNLALNAWQNIGAFSSPVSNYIFTRQLPTNLPPQEFYRTVSP